MNLGKVIIRENEDDKELLDVEEFKADLLFQINEDYETHEMYQEYLMEDVENPLSFDEYVKDLFESKLEDISNGYSIEILGDTYYKKLD